MEPQNLVDVSSQLRGLGFKASKTTTVRPWPTCPHTRPEELSMPWARFEAGCRPKAARNPALGADYVLDCIKPSAPGVATDSIIDVRCPTEIIGTSSRVDSRYESDACLFR